MKGLSLSIALLMTFGMFVAGCSSQQSVEPPATDQAMMEPPAEAPKPLKKKGGAGSEEVEE